ncbi:MAG TPA: bifunctional nuclease family protein [Myxococcota bacterium]|nr:bifunctional nuclease family protein [Myxococcota bacterium]
MAARFLRRALFFLVLGCSTSGRAPSDEVSVHVARLEIDPQTGSPVLVLTEDGGERTLALWIGFAEASSIAAEMQQVRPPRPNTHDLLQHVIADLGGRLERVVVTELHESTYYAVLRVEAHGKLVEIDARPSDAIAVALRVAAPLFVRESLFENARNAPEGSDGGQETRFVPGGPESRVGRSEAEKEKQLPALGSARPGMSALSAPFFVHADVRSPPATVSPESRIPARAGPFPGRPEDGNRRASLTKLAMGWQDRPASTKPTRSRHSDAASVDRKR